MNADPDSQSLLLQLGLLVILTLINGFLAAAEIAVVSVNKNRVEQKAEEGNLKSKKLLEVIQSPNNFLSTIQVGITLVNILSGASLADSLSARLAPLLGGGSAARPIAAAIVMLLLTYVSIVFGELYPKRIAMTKTEEVAQFTSGVVRKLGIITKPFVWLLTASTNLLAKITPMTFDDEDTKMTRDEMRYMLENEGVLDNDEIEMLQGVFSLDTKVAREVMVPRTDSFMIDINDPVLENIDEILNESYSRIPVYDEDKDKVVGILHTKTLLKAARQFGFENVVLQKILQEPLFVPETIFVDDLLKELRNTQNQMAILLDEYGGMSGLVTLEDLLEEIVGEIDDETDKAEIDVFEIADNTYVVQGAMSLNDFNEYFDVELESDDVDTIAGYYLTEVGRIPTLKERLSCEVDSQKKHLILTNDKVKNGRVTKVKVEISELIEEDEETKTKEE